MGNYLSTKIDPTVRLSIDKRLTTSIASNGKEEFNQQVQWCDLPSIPLEKIYSFLSRPDQVNMSLVCRKWSKGFHSPSVWKTFRFALTESQLSTDICPAMKFVKTYSNMFRHVEIRGTFTENNGLMKNLCRHVVEFLQILTKSTQLISVEFRCFSYCFRHIDTVTYNDISRAIADFLASQHHLKRVEFYYCPFVYKESVELLRILIENNRKSLTNLKLEEFLSDENRDFEQDSNAAQKLPMLADLPSLKTLDADYSFIFESMVLRQSTAIQTGRNFKNLALSKLILDNCRNYTEIEEYFRGLTSTDWRLLKTLYPDLQVELDLTIDYAARQVFKFFILPNMQICILKYANVDFNTGSQIAVLFEHLLKCKTNEYLVTLHLDWDESTQHLSSTFITFFQACKKLKCLELRIFSRSSGIDVLLESWLENRPEYLEKVKIDFYVYNENDFPGLSNIIEYVSLLKLAGLNISLNLS